MASSDTMSLIDQFESVFRAASKPVFRPTPRRFESVLLLTDLPQAEADAYATRVKALLAGARGMGAGPWIVGDAAFAPTVGDLLARIDEHQPDLVIAYRNLHSSGWKWPYTLGDHVAVLTQVTQVPVLLLPRPDQLDPERGTDNVMAMTDHLAGEATLVDAAIALTHPGGALHLAHVEDEATFTRFMRLVAKIPNLPTEEAEAGLRAQMLKEPSDYIESVRAALAESDLKVVAAVQMGHHLSTYRQLIAQHGIDLLVLNTKDDDQLAMHGLAYPLAVELRDLPLLML